MNLSLQSHMPIASHQLLWKKKYSLSGCKWLQAVAAKSTTKAPVA